MFFLLFVFTFIGTSFCNETEEIKVFCPNGWLAQGQVIYVKNVSKIANESEYSLCLVCQLNSILKHPYHIIEVCVSTSDLLENNEIHCKSAVCQTKPNKTKQHWKLMNQCDTLDYQPVCGMKINMTDKTLKEAMDDVEFVPCKKLSYHQTFFENKKFSVDLVCPESFVFESVNVREAIITQHKSSTQDKSRAFCLICNHRLNSSEISVSFCSSVLCAPHESNTIRHLKTKTEYQLSICDKEESYCYQNATDVNDYCGYR
jgi:hypothetical protein